MSTQSKVTKVELINHQTGETTDLTPYVRSVSYTLEPQPYSAPRAEIPTDPRVQAYMLALLKLVSLRMSASMFGMQRSEAWVQSQLTDADRAALAKDVTND